MKQSLLASALIGGTMLAGIVNSPAQAGTIGCASVSGDLANSISGSIGCQISGTIGATIGSATYVNPGVSNDSPTPGAVNTEQFFGTSDWAFLGKSDSTLSSYFTGFSPPNSGIQGTYNLGSLFSGIQNLANVMLIFKSGQGTSLVGYLLDNRVNPFQGSWQTPFTNPPFPLFTGNPSRPTFLAAREVSHISVYYRVGAPLEIPTPALLPGLVALGAGVLRKKKQAEQDA